MLSLTTMKLMAAYSHSENPLLHLHLPSRLDLISTAAALAVAEAPMTTTTSANLTAPRESPPTPYLSGSRVPYAHPLCSFQDD